MGATRSKVVEHVDNIAVITSSAEGGVQHLRSITSGPRRTEFRKTAVKLAALSESITHTRATEIRSVYMCYT